MEIIFFILALGVAVLQVLLFIKIWRMTDHIADIRPNVQTITETLISGGGVYSQFAWAFAQSLTEQAIRDQKTGFTPISFIRLNSISISSEGGYIVNSDWVLAHDGKRLQFSINALLRCNNMQDFMNPKTWTATIL